MATRTYVYRKDPFLCLSAIYSLVILLGISRFAVGFDLTIVHNNDVHAHIGQINKYSGECSDKDAKADKCFGGEARRVTFIKGNV